ncbi:MAG: hypothetical protein IIA11_07535, partial [Proteobacteria bacterium]|nr:hypothetical protein [Pseudomonadota bacterium]
MKNTNPPRKKVERKFKRRKEAPPPLRVHPLQRLGAFTISVVMAFYPFAGYANPALPTGPDIVHGGVTIGVDGQIMNIDQTTAAAISFPRHPNDISLYPEQVLDLIGYLHDDLGADHPFSSVSA